MTPKTDASVAARALQVSLRSAFQLIDGNPRALIEDAIESDPEIFFQAGFHLLQSTPPCPERGRIFAGILGQPAFLLALIRRGRFPVRELCRICKKFSTIDRYLDLRLARLLPGRWEDTYSLPAEVIVRILHVLEEISDGARLIPVLSHLTSHAHPAVAERATLLVGKRVRNWGWAQRRLESGGPDVRAGVVEGLWGVDTPQARRAMRNCLQDSSERVVGRAIFGLHLLQEDDVRPLVERMSKDDRPAFRATAAWLAGQIGQSEYNALLDRAREDSSPMVRLAAKEAMAVRRQASLARQQASLARQPAKAAQPLPQRQAPPPPKPPTPRKRELHVRLDGKSATTRWG